VTTSEAFSVEALTDQASERALGHMVNRLHYVEDRRQHPDIAAERVERPVFIIGMPHIVGALHGQRHGGLPRSGGRLDRAPAEDVDAGRRGAPHELGVDPQQVRTEFAGYINQFSLEPQTL